MDTLTSSVMLWLVLQQPAWPVQQIPVSSCPAKLANIYARLLPCIYFSPAVLITLSLFLFLSKLSPWMCSTLYLVHEAAEGVIFPKVLCACVCALPCVREGAEGNWWYHSKPATPSLFAPATQMRVLSSWTKSYLHLHPDNCMITALMLKARSHLTNWTV